MQEEHLTHYPRSFRECLIPIQHLPRYLGNDFNRDQHCVNIPYLSWGTTTRPGDGIESIDFAWSTVGVEVWEQQPAASFFQPIWICRAVFACWQGPLAKTAFPCRNLDSIEHLLPRSCGFASAVLQATKKEAHLDSLLWPLALESDRCP